jgi:hypothetical protein
MCLPCAACAHLCAEVAAALVESLQKAIFLRLQGSGHLQKTDEAQQQQQWAKHTSGHPLMQHVHVSRQHNPWTLLAAAADIQCAQWLLL